MSDVELDQQQEQLRGQVLSAALALGLRAADAGEATPGAAFIQLNDDVLVAAVTWKLRAQWNASVPSVRLTGRPPRPSSSEDDAIAFSFLLIFGAADDGANGSFDFTVPVAWLRDAARAHDPRAAGGTDA